MLHNEKVYVRPKYVCSLLLCNPYMVFSHGLEPLFRLICSVREGTRQRSELCRFCSRAPASHLGFFITKWCLDYMQLWVKNVIINIINHGIFSDSAAARPEQWLLVRTWTASSPPANSCVLVSLPQRDLWWDSRSISVRNGESVSRCRTIFSPSRQKDGRLRTTVLLNSHLARGADVLWHGGVDACLFG